MDMTFSIPPPWIPLGGANGGHQRLTGLNTVKTIAFIEGVQGIYIQALTQNVRITLDGTAPAASGNTTGFVLRTTDPPVLIVMAQGITIKLIEEAASAVVQYQLLKISNRFSVTG